MDYSKTREGKPYPFETIFSLLEFCGIPEVRKELTNDGKLRYIQTVYGVPVDSFAIFLDTESDEDYFLIIEKDGTVSDFNPHYSWDDLMYILPMIHMKIHEYMKACTTSNQDVVCKSLHKLIVKLENEILVHYSIEHTWSQFEELSTAISGITKYLPPLNA
jgi:hypothetical protein